MLLGAGIYLLWRSPVLRVFGWVRAVGLGDVLGSLREAVAGWPVPDVVLYVLPDMLWTYALTAFMAHVWRDRMGPGALVWLSSGVVIGSGGELLQAAGILPGTFDWLDLVGCAAAGLLSGFLAHRRHT
ncbi:MAG: hypothetical protein GY913_14570 [Proteobacteria bacterium]|nr:hypothetical protein [Pseudomonadota bacterium]MCP4918134.1 hypothetical protein [Pseudomonadota bacterium]